MKNSKNFYYALSILSLCLFSSCSSSDKEIVKDGQTVTSTVVNAPVVSHRAYERGLAEGKRIAKMDVDSRERERALIDIQGMASALERNGYKQSARDFVKGVNEALTATLSNQSSE